MMMCVEKVIVLIAVGIWRFHCNNWNSFTCLQHLSFSTVQAGLLSFDGKQKATVKEIVDHLSSVYCNQIGAEFTHLQVG